MQEDGASDAFAGVAFHCYIGQVDNQDVFHNNFPEKELYFTECSGMLGSDFWTDLQVGLQTPILLDDTFRYPSFYSGT